MRRCVLKELATAPAAFGAAFNTSLPPCAVCPDPEHGRKRGGARVDLKSLALNYAVAEGHARPATGMPVCPLPPPPRPVPPPRRPSPARAGPEPRAAAPPCGLRAGGHARHPGARAAGEGREQPRASLSLSADIHPSVLNTSYDRVRL
jgi:hypothetical protein